MNNKPLSKEQAERYAKNLEKVVKQLKKDVEKLILDNSVVKNGIVTAEVERVTSLYAQIKELIETSDFLKETNQSLIENQAILGQRIEAISKVFPNYDFAGFPIEKLQAITDLDLSMIGGQTDLAFNKVRELVQLNVVNGLLLADLTLTLESILENNLVHNAGTLMATAKRMFAQKLENLVADEIGFTEDDQAMWEYVGDPLVPNSHEECVWVLQDRIHPYFTNEQKSAFEAGTYPEFLAGRSAIRYNCHHNFWMTSLTKQEVEKEYGVAE